MTIIVAILMVALMVVGYVATGRLDHYFNQTADSHYKVDWLKVAQMEVEIYGTIKSYQAQGEVDKLWWKDSLEDVALQQFVSRRLVDKAYAIPRMHVEPITACEYQFMINPWDDREGE